LINLETLVTTTLPFAQEKAFFFSPPKFLGVQERPDLLQLFELSESGARLIAGSPIAPMPASNIACSPEKRLLAWTQDLKTIHVTNVDQPENHIDLSSGESAHQPLMFSSDGEHLLATVKGVARMWSLAERTRLPAAEAYLSPQGLPVVWGLGKRLGWGGHALAQWITCAIASDAAQSSHGGDKALSDPNLFRTDRAFSPDGHTHALSFADGKVQLFDAKPGIEVTTLHGHQSSVYCLTFSPDGTRLAVGGDVLWDLNTRQELITLPTAGGDRRHAEFSDDGSTLLIGGPTGTGIYQFWRAPSWQEIEQAERDGHGWPQAASR
jgi:WD40 repeat protein